jgi:hypothetical protein
MALERGNPRASPRASLPGTTHRRQVSSARGARPQRPSRVRACRAPASMGRVICRARGAEGQSGLTDRSQSTARSRIAGVFLCVSARREHAECPPAREPSASAHTSRGPADALERLRGFRRPSAERESGKACEPARWRTSARSGAGLLSARTWTARVLGGAGGLALTGCPSAAPVLGAPSFARG